MNSTTSHNSIDSVSTGALILWLFSKLAPFKARVFFALLALLLSALSWLALGQGVRFAVDEGFAAQSTEALDRIMLLLIAIVMLGSIAAYVRFYLMIWLGERVSADIRIEVYAHLLRLSPSFYERTRTGEVISRFTSDTTLLQTVIGFGLSMLLRSSVTLIGALIFMVITSPLLTLYTLIALPFILIPIRILGPKVRRFARQSQDRVADVSAYVDESLHEINTVQSYTHEGRDRSLFNSRVEAVMAAASDRIRYRSLLFALVLAISTTAVALVAWLGARDVLTGALSAGELTAFLFYGVMAGGSVAAISEVIGEVQKAAGASERLRELLQTESDIKEPDSPVKLATPVQGRLSIEEVSFCYPSAPDRVVLSDLSLHIAPGERVALVGASGAGKSTLFQLLLRFYDLSAGSIRLDDVPIEDLSLSALRAQYALVPQDSVIFATTALENIRYGRPDASEAEVIAAAKAARAHSFIQELSQGYETELGERGVRLSGGQKQRISIARALLSDRPILLLDEATSALDAVSEQQVKLALDALMAGRTTLIIAHRLSTVINADRILLLDRGRVVDSGSHEALYQRSALYREYADLQLVVPEPADRQDQMQG